MKNGIKDYAIWKLFKSELLLNRATSAIMLFWKTAYEGSCIFKEVDFEN